MTQIIGHQQQAKMTTSDGVLRRSSSSRRSSSKVSRKSLLRSRKRSNSRSSSSHKERARGRRPLSHHSNDKPKDKKVSVEKKTQSDESSGDVERKLILTNLSRNVTELHLKEILGCFCSVPKIELIKDVVRPARLRANLECASKEAADAIKLHLNKGQIDGETIYISQPVAVQKTTPVKREASASGKRRDTSQGSWMSHSARPKRYARSPRDRKNHSSKDRTRSPLNRRHRHYSPPPRRIRSPIRSKAIHKPITERRPLSVSSSRDRSLERDKKRRSSSASSWSSQSRSRSRSRNLLNRRPLKRSDNRRSKRHSSSISLDSTGRRRRFTPKR